MPCFERYTTSALLFGALCFGAVSPLAAQPAAPAATQPEDAREKLEQQFADELSGAVLTGSYTLTEDENADREGADGLKQDKYTLGEVRKLPNGKWLFETRIQYGEHDLALPLTLDIVWAGDTPVITLTDFAVPGLGKFTARVLFHRGHYAGTWSGGDHGGHLFGRWEKRSPESATGDAATPQTRAR